MLQGRCQTCSVDPFYRVNARSVIGCRALWQGVLPRFWSWDAGAAPAPLGGWVVSSSGRPVVLNHGPARPGVRGTLWTNTARSSQSGQSFQSARAITQSHPDYEKLPGHEHTGL